MNTLKRLLLGSLLAFAFMVQAEPVGTAFTYQGELQQSGTPASGSYDFQFDLFSVELNGDPVTTPIQLENVDVQDGVFTVELDFGSASFSGEQLWLEIGVREGASTGGFQGLAPRQQISAAPFALLSQRVAAGSVGTGEIIPDQVQRRVMGVCAVGTVLIGINQDGSLICATFADQVPDVEARIATLEEEPAGLACVQGETVMIGGVTYTIPKAGLSILSVGPNLGATGFQPFTVQTCDWTQNGALLNIYQTVAEGGWNEEHNLPTLTQTEATPTSPRVEQIELAISEVDTIGELTNSTTLFNSDDEGVLTYVLRVYDSNGLLADCIAWGHDVPAVFSGAAPDINPTTDASEISPANCADLSG